MANRMLGAILILSGTAIGAGMLALPMTLGPLGLWPAIFSIIIAAIVLAYPVFLLLEVALSRQSNSGNYISLVGELLGPQGQCVAWLCCLLLLYSASAAYLSGAGPLLQHVLHTNQLDFLGTETGLVLFLLIFGGASVLQTHWIDRFNRILMLALFLSFLVLAAGLVKHTSIMTFADHSVKHAGGHWPYLIAALPVLFLSFACQPVFLSLCRYCDNDVTVLKQVILVSFALPAGLYLVWLIAVMGIVPVTGALGLEALATAESPVSALVDALSNRTHLDWLADFAASFSFFALATSYLAVMLSLIDFIVDGLPERLTAGRRPLAILLALLPPVLFVYLFKSGFVFALGYAGVFVAILYILLPVFMVARLRQQQTSAQRYRAPGGCLALGGMAALSIIVILCQIWSTLSS